MSGGVIDLARGRVSLRGDCDGGAPLAGEGSRLSRLWARLKEHPLARVGPGLITGVADDDPSGIATYSQAGAQFGLNMLWTVVVAFPMMGAVQSMCARIGRVTGKGLAANIKAAFPAPVLRIVVALLLIANILNIAADISAMGEVAQLATGIDRKVMTVGFALLTLGLQVLVPYHRYVAYLKWLTLSLLAYAAVLFTVRVPWGQVALRTFWPDIRLDAATATVATGVFGTTISPYLFFWQASEEVEDLNLNKQEHALIQDPAEAPKELSRIRWDTWTGMFYSDLTSFFIILATAVTLHVAGVTNIETAAQAASALRPLAGDFAYILFALGILGVGLIGVPVLAGSAAYGVAEAMGWKEGLELKATDARGFYGVIAVAVLAGLTLEFSPIDPFKALFWSAVINGVVAVPLLAVITILASKRSVMGPFVAGRTLVVLGWITTGVMGLAALAMLLPS
jgi:NRAMP (natural resistance-associated macrophage protein)-like metal ion transporter